jgi:hypothetical protein
MLSALTIMLLMSGLVVAAEFTLSKYDPDKKEVTVKDGEKDVTYKITDKVKVTVIDKDGNATEGKFEDLEKRLKNPKSAGKFKIDITTDKETITEVKYTGKKK